MKKFEIPLLPESVNRAYTIDPRKKTLVLTRRAWRRKGDMHIFVPKIEIPQNHLIKLEYQYHADWYFKKGTIRRVDAQNYDKMLIDVICEKQGIDDCRVIDWHGQKIQNNTREFVVVAIYLIDEDQFINGQSIEKSTQSHFDGSAKDHGSLWD